MLGRIPAPALLLGLAGLIPFVWAALLALQVFAVPDLPIPKVLLGDGQLLMIRYGGIILPFMSGVLWGFATNAHGKQAVAAYALSCVDGSLFASPFSRMVFRQKQSCVRPVSATHMAAGPDGFHQPSPIPHIEQQAFWTKLGVSWFLG
jgi:hypothetical protein